MVDQSDYLRGVARPALAIRHHPVLLLARAWQPGLLLLAAAVLVVIFASAPAGMALSGFWLVIVGAVFLLGAIWMAWAYLGWNNDRLYLTATRLIEVSGIEGPQRGAARTAPGTVAECRDRFPQPDHALVRLRRRDHLDHRRRAIALRRRARAVPRARSYPRPPR
jgi:uncharacterized membrane protein YgcG